MEHPLYLLGPPRFWNPKVGSKVTPPNFRNPKVGVKIYHSTHPTPPEFSGWEFRPPPYLRKNSGWLKFPKFSHKIIKTFDNNILNINKKNRSLRCEHPLEGYALPKKSWEPKFTSPPLSKFQNTSFPSPTSGPRNQNLPHTPTTPTQLSKSQSWGQNLPLS